MKKPDKLPIMHRTMEVEMQVEARTDEATLYDISVSSEAEVTRWFGIEVLDHSRGAVDMSRMKNGAGVLIDHYSDQVGVVRNFRLDADAKKTRAKVQFSRSQRGQDVERDVADGIRQNVSVGYRVLEMKLQETRDGGIPVYRVTRWMPVEVSFVGVPADATVGVNRSEGAGEEFPVNLDDGPAVEEERMLQHRKLNGGGAGGAGEGGGTTAPAPATTTQTVVVTKDNRADVAEILEMCETNGMTARAAEWIRAGHDANAVARLILAERKTNGTAQPGSESVERMGASKKDVKRYSYARAIAMQADGECNGFEGEVHTELMKRVPAGMKLRGGTLLPMRLSEYEERTLDSKTQGKGVEVVPEQLGDIIELLRNRALVLQMGARLLTGLSSPVTFPRQTGAITTQWMAENNAVNVTASDIALGLALLSPKTLQATTGYSRQFLNLASVDIEAWIRDELATVHALAIDRAAIHGAGSNGEPVGIYKQAGTLSQSFSVGNLSYANLLAMQTAVANNNSLLGSLAYLMSPTSAGTAKGTTDFAGSAPGRPIWDGPFTGGNVAGYPAYATNQVSIVMSTGGNDATGGSDHGCIFGNWNDIIVGMFAAMEIIVDPYALKKQGLIEVTSFQMCDVLIRHPESFCKANNLTN